MAQRFSRRSVLGSASAAFAATQASAARAAGQGGFPLIRNGTPAGLLIDEAANSAIHHVARNFALDLERVGGTKAALQFRAEALPPFIVIIGVIGQCRYLDQLAKAGLIDLAGLAGQWEGYRRIVIDNPFPSVRQALVIAGSDRRGAVFGTYDLSEQIGVSPWHWFADVPVTRGKTITIARTTVSDQPKVRYRGFFINDEEPGFGGWARKTFGGFNAKLYAPIFELLLRLKGNYLWPAMWLPKAFNDDDPQNMVLADEMGVIMGTSHHEPMMRAQHEWRRGKEQGVTGGKWDYAKNSANLRSFWRGGIERMMGRPGGYDSLVTIGMRGDGDEPMAEGAAIGLLEKIITDQRVIIADVTKKPAEQTPQIWALYKEVQDYYDHGMQVPDDVILLFADDNWGQIRRLPKPDQRGRKGGYGVYYHFDYVGGPRNYRWLNTNQIEKVWQQMDLAWQSGAQAAWIVNVGDIKPMEFPLSFFLKMAWNPDAMTPDALRAFPAQWAAEQFGAGVAERVGDLLTRFSQYAARRKPELVDATSFALGEEAGDTLDGGEFGEMVAAWAVLERDMLATKARLKPAQHDAWFQLVEHPIRALATLYRLSYAVAWNHTLAAANDARANHFADVAEAEYRRDAQWTAQYHALNVGKWDGMMAQIHIGYTGWQEPPEQVMPKVHRVAEAGQPARSIRFAKPGPPPKAVIAIEAPRFSRSFGSKGLRWATIPRLGRTMGAMLAMPQGKDSTTPEDGVRIEYDVHVAVAGEAMLTLYLVPTLDTARNGGTRIGISLDDGPVQILTATLEPTPGELDTPPRKAWGQAVCDNVVKLSTRLGQVNVGRHVVKVWRIDDNMPAQKLVLATGAVVERYLGPRA